MALTCTPPNQNYASPAQGDFLVGDWQWYPACNDWFWNGQKRALGWGWVGNPWSGYQHVPKPAASPTGQPLGTPPTPSTPAAGSQGGQVVSASPNELHLPVASQQSPVAAGPAGTPAQGGYSAMVPPSAAIPVDVYRPEEPPPEYQYPVPGWTPSDGDKETAPPEEPDTPPAETTPCKKWHVFLGDTRFPVAGDPTKEAVAEATGVALKNLAIVSVDEETCTIQAAVADCQCEPSVNVVLNPAAWANSGLNDESRMVEEAVHLRLKQASAANSDCTIASFPLGLYNGISAPRTADLPARKFDRRGTWLVGPEDGSFRRDTVGSKPNTQQRLENDWWLFRKEPNGNLIWMGFQCPFAVIMKFTPATCRAISNILPGVQRNSEEPRLGLTSIYGQWVKFGEQSFGLSQKFEFDQTRSGYDPITIGADVEGRLITRTDGVAARCLVFCDSPGIAVASGLRPDIDSHYAGPLGRASRVRRRDHIAWVNKDRTRFHLARPLYFEGSFFVRCTDSSNREKTVGLTFWWAFRPTLTIESIKPKSADGMQMEPILEIVNGVGRIPWDDTERYRMTVAPWLFHGPQKVWFPPDTKPLVPLSGWPNPYTGAVWS